MIKTKIGLKRELIRVYKMSELEANHRVERLQKDINELTFKDVEDIVKYCISQTSIDNVDYVKIFCKCRVV